MAIITSAFFSSMSFAGLFSGSLFQRFGMRQVGVTGGILYFLGTGMQLFATSTLHLIMAFSVVQGFAFGLMVPTCYTTFNHYFVKNRVMWMSFAQTLIGLGSMLYPIVMQKLMSWYGFRGCLLILTGLNAHAVFGMLVMHPVEWHMRRVPIQPEEQEELKELSPTVVIRVQPETPLKATREEPNFHTADPGARKLSHAEEQMLKVLSSRASSITSLGNWSGPVVVSDASPQMMHSLQTSRRPSTIAGASGAVAPAHATKKSWVRTIVDFLDLTLLKKPIFVNIVLGITFALYSDITFFTMQPVYLFELGYSRPDTATIIAIGAAADLASRIFLAITAVCIQVPSRYIYLAGAVFTVFARFGRRTLPWAPRTPFLPLISLIFPQPSTESHSLWAWPASRRSLDFCAPGSTFHCLWSLPTTCPRKGSPLAMAFSCSSKAMPCSSSVPLLGLFGTRPGITFSSFTS
uniref:RE57622p n=1 Tax=Drosophila melanogaster TaxID=7227 RepID=Q6AWN8_DROME